MLLQKAGPLPGGATTASVASKQQEWSCSPYRGWKAAKKKKSSLSWSYTASHYTVLMHLTDLRS
jgi:hypothetical protein